MGGEGALGEGWELWEREVVGGIKRSPLPISCVKRYTLVLLVLVRVVVVVVVADYFFHEECPAHRPS